MIYCDIRTGKVLEGKANYVIILDHFMSLITICYHCHFMGLTPAAATSLRLSEAPSEDCRGPAKGEDGPL